MRDELLGYYERELVFMRQMGAEFAQKYPKIAARLQLEADKCEDPHVERIIEAAAFLAARVQLKIDDEFPEITESFLNVLYPHYLAPVPSMSIAQFALDADQSKLTVGYDVARSTTLYTRPVQGTPCRFRTVYPVTILPLTISAAALESRVPVNARGRLTEAAIRISVRGTSGAPLAQMKIGAGDVARNVERLRFYLNGEPQIVYPLYEMLFNNVTHVELRAPENGATRGNRARSPVLTLPASHLKQVGFEPDEGMLPYTARSFLGYRLLTEYFTFPEKFLFFDLLGLDEAARAGLSDQFDILIHLKDVQPPRAQIDQTVFQFNCTPVVNLFEKIAEPVQLTAQQHEYHIIPDVHRQSATEIYSIDAVTTTDPYLKESREFQPFYSFSHAREAGNAGDRTFWYASRRPSQRESDAGTEINLSLVDLDFNPHVPTVETLTVHTTCTNRDLPERLPFGGQEGDFEVEGALPIDRVRCLRKPTSTLRPAMRRAAQWRLISHLSLNHLSLVESETNTPEALQEILLLYDFLDSSATRKQIAGITGVAAKRVVRQMGTRIGAGFVRGLETTVEFDEEEYVGSGVFLLASVLERFLGLYASINSFNQLVAITKQREGILKRWHPRAGEQMLL